MSENAPLIEISDDLAIGTDGTLNFTILRKNIPKKGPQAGQVVWRPEAWYGNIGPALKAALRKTLMQQEDVDSVEDLRDRVNYWGERLERLAMEAGAELKSPTGRIAETRPKNQQVKAPKPKAEGSSSKKVKKEQPKKKKKRRKPRSLV